jgi:hypothetical protein
MCHFVWIITFDLSGMGDATTGIGLRIIYPLKPHHHVKVLIPTRGGILGP